MTRTKLALALGLVAVVGVAVGLGGAAGNGVLAGGFLAGSAGVAGLMVQLRFARSRPNLATAGLALSFGVKLVALLASVAAFVLVPALA
jgi:hypothetical protein